MIDGPPDVVSRPIDIHEDLVELPRTVARFYPLDLILADIRWEHRARFGGVQPFIIPSVAANWANEQRPGLSWPLLIMFATSLPSGGAEAEAKGLKAGHGSDLLLNRLQQGSAALALLNDGMVIHAQAIQVIATRRDLALRR